MDVPFLSPLEEETSWFIFSDKSLLLTNHMTLPKTTDAGFEDDIIERQKSFIHKGHVYVAATLKDNYAVPQSLHLKDFRELYLSLPPTIMEVARKASQILEWDKRHQYCGACGSLTTEASQESSKICTNISCGERFYPSICPVIMVAVEKGEDILLARSPHFPAHIYSILAGFVEPGENAEEAVMREVYEETNIYISNVRYFDSQPWQFPTQLILGFQAEYESGTITIDSQEIEHADFFPATALPPLFPGNFSLAQKLIKDFCQRKFS